MGIVFEATHLRLRQTCAIKVLLPEALANVEYVARFEREAQVAATLKDPHVVQVLDVDTTPDGIPYIVMELLRGQDLADEIAARGPLPIDEAAGHAFTVCVTLAHAHGEHIIHRDLKPSNLFLADQGDRRVLKLLDFGISKLTREGEGHITSSASIFGTPFYMSPEQVRSVRTVDGRSDLWSLGVVLYEMLTGRVPFQGTPTACVAAIVADPVEPPRTLRSDIPDELERIILKALQKDPALRFASAAEMGTSLEPFAGSSTRPLPRQTSSSRVSLAGIRTDPSSKPPADAIAEVVPPSLAYARTQEIGSDPIVEVAAQTAPREEEDDDDRASPVIASEPAASETPAIEPSPTVGKTAWSRPPPAPSQRNPRLIVGAIVFVAAVVLVVVLVIRATGTTDRPTATPLVASAADPAVVGSATLDRQEPPMTSSTLLPLGVEGAPPVAAASSAQRKGAPPTAHPTTSTHRDPPKTTSAPAAPPAPASVAPPAPTRPSSSTNPAKANPLTL
jgi:eukaryotic-like serine/threonine-protein kinase